MSDHGDRMRALERLRVVETHISKRVEELRHWLASDLARHWQDAGRAGNPPGHPPADRIELWWRDPLPGDALAPGRETLDRIPVLAEWLAVVDQESGERYQPGRGDGQPLGPLLENLLSELEEARALRNSAGVRPS